MNTQLKLPFEDSHEAIAANDNQPLNWQQRFELYDKENPHVYELVKKYTFEAIASGQKHFSMASIIERIRWFTEIETTGDPFKINQNYQTYYGRKFMQEFPQHEGFFRTRKLRG
jgi:hypothetical protein